MAMVIDLDSERKHLRDLQLYKYFDKLNHSNSQNYSFHINYSNWIKNVVQLELLKYSFKTRN